MPLGDPDDVGMALERADDLLRQRAQLDHQRLALDLAERPPQLREPQREQDQQRHLGGEGLRRCDADLDPSVRV